MIYPNSPEARLIELNGKVISLSYQIASLKDATSDRKRLASKARKELVQLAGELYLLKSEIGADRCQSVIDEVLQTITSLSVHTWIGKTRRLPLTSP